MKLLRNSILLAGCTLIAACGGGGGVASTPAPAPAPAPTPAPTPAPAPAPAPTPAPTPTPTALTNPPPPVVIPQATTGTLLQALTMPQGFVTGSLQLDADYTGERLSSINRPYGSATSLKLYIEPDKGTVTTYDTLGGGFAFTDSYRTGKIGFEGWGANSIEAARRLLYRIPEQGDQQYPDFALTYTSYGEFTADTARGGYEGQTLDTFFYFGIPTAIADLPRSGRASYSGLAAGELYDMTGVYTLDGIASLTADFAANSVETTMQLKAFAPGTTLDLGIFDGLAQFDSAANSFRGTWVASSTGYEGSILGSFFGPAAAEFGYSFGINKPDLTAIGGGVVVGGQNTSLPTPPPPPPPTPPPPAPPGSTFPLASAQTFSTFTAKTSYSGSTIGGNAAIDPATSGPLSDAVSITVVPDYVNGTYTVHDGSASLAFQLPALSKAPDPNNKLVTLTDTGDDRLLLFNNLATGTGTNDPLLQLHYLSFAFLYQNDNATAEHSTTALLFGTPTLVADVPRSGTATYALQGFASGLLSGFEDVQGTLTADFAAGTVHNSFMIYNYSGASLGAIYHASGDGSIAAGTPFFSGSLTEADRGLTGSFNGGFFGPSAAEAGFTFALSGTEGDNQQRIVGAVGGTR